MEERQIPDKLKNIQAEMMFVGAMYSDPTLYIRYGNDIRSAFDFIDPATKFFYDMFESIYTTFSEEMDEAKVDLFMTQDTERLKRYRQYDGYKFIKELIELADPADIEKYYAQLKKYSLLREYYRKGYPAMKIVEHPLFPKMEAKDIYKLIRSEADKINTIISAKEESVNLLEGNEDLMLSYLEKPDIGLSFPWHLITEMARGIRPKHFFLCGFLSNAGKTRNLMYLAATIVFLHEEKFLLLSNEMDEQDLRNCLITTVLNNEPFRSMHGVRIRKPEREIVLGLYRDDVTHKFIQRKQDEDGVFTETLREYKKRMFDNSKEFRDVLRVCKWIDERTKGKLYLKDVGADYSDSALEFEIKKHKTLYGIKYMGYDTLKPYNDIGDWSILKRTATRLKELSNETDVFIWADMQLTDDTVFVPVDELSSNNIASCKGIKHVADFLILGKRISPEEYDNYRYIPEDVWGNAREAANQRWELDPNKRYFGMKIDKNRAGNKDKIPLIEQDLDINMWKEVGCLVKKGM
jgi:replicative DNA helicase